MITIESKLDKFRETILGKIERDSEFDRFQSSADEERLLANRREELENEARELAMKEAKRAEVDYLKIISDAKVLCNSKALEAREAMFEEVMKSLGKLASVFQTSEEYRSYMRMQVKTLPIHFEEQSQLDLTCFLEDKSFILKQLEEEGFRGELNFKELNKSYLGGFIVEETKYSSRFNLTLKGILDDHADLIGQKLYELIEKTGE